MRACDNVNLFGLPLTLFTLHLTTVLLFYSSDNLILQFKALSSVNIGLNCFLPSLPTPLTNTFSFPDTKSLEQSIQHIFRPDHACYTSNGQRIGVLLPLRQCRRRMLELESGEEIRDIQTCIKECLKNIDTDSRCTRCLARVMSGAFVLFMVWSLMLKLNEKG